MKQHIIYIPGLGDKYDFIRKIGLQLWRRKDVKVSHFPIKWENARETYDDKLDRLQEMIDTYPEAKVIVVGESAGGSVAISATRRFKNKIDSVVTVCGMNYGANNVNPALYRKNRAFHEAMLDADRVIPTLNDDERSRLNTIYSSMDFTVRPKNTLIAGVSSHDLKIAGHAPSILTVLFFRYDLILK
jgi:pimeloyl-ACP methyl ester carboxylesterase